MKCNPLTPSQLFAWELGKQLGKRNLRPADTLRKKWPPEITAAVMEAMAKSPVLFTNDSVAQFMGINPSTLRSRINRYRKTAAQ
jgi:hypothetical protein